MRSVNNLLDFLEKVFNGGSDFNEPVNRCLSRLTDAKWANSDILLVSGAWGVGLGGWGVLGCCVLMRHTPPKLAHPSPPHNPSTPLDRLPIPPTPHPTPTSPHPHTRRGAAAARAGDHAEAFGRQGEAGAARPRPHHRVAREAALRPGRAARAVHQLPAQRQGGAAGVGVCKLEVGAGARARPVCVG